jgi:SWI/SNF related-matrix-associated actin-dependent regulator of chromatin subfamily C
LNQKTRRDIYDANGKEATAPESKDKPANGEAAANGTPTPADVKALEAAHNEPARLYTCYSCGVDCTRVRQHLSKPSPTSGAKPTAGNGHDICMKCYMEGRFPASYTAADYIKLEDENYKALPDRSRAWTEQETLNLLEALELFDEDWNKVAEHVPGRTREECVMKFLQLEIEDNYLEADVPPAESGPMSLGYLRDGRIPFSQADNPVLSVLGHLVTLADPHVTAAAAGKAIPEQMRILKQVMDKIPTSSEAEKGKEKEKVSVSDVKNEDAMEVDSAPSPQPNESNQVATTGGNASQNANPLATLPFALSAVRSSALASHEERHITRLVSGAVNMQLQKLQLKLSQFNDFENLLSAERRDLERRRQQLFLDRLAFQKRVKGLEDVCKRITQSTGGAQGLPGQMSVEDAINTMTEGIKMFGVGKGEEKGGVKRTSVDANAAPVEEGGDGFAKLEV